VVNRILEVLDSPIPVSAAHHRLLRRWPGYRDGENVTAARSEHAVDFSKSLAWIGDMLHHVTAENNIESRVRKGKRLKILMRRLVT
jgi:hypothetical protein